MSSNMVSFIQSQGFLWVDKIIGRDGEIGLWKRVSLSVTLLILRGVSWPVIEWTNELGDNHSELLFKVNMESSTIRHCMLLKQKLCKNWDLRLNYDCLVQETWTVIQTSSSTRRSEQLTELSLAKFIICINICAILNHLSASTCERELHLLLTHCLIKCTHTQSATKHPLCQRTNTELRSLLCLMACKHSWLCLKWMSTLVRKLHASQYTGFMNLVLKY